MGSATSSLPDSVAARDSSDRYPLMVSVPERAWLELLADVPGRISFESANAIGEGLRTLRPTPLENLLRAVRSVKVKRLALWFADRHAQPWRDRLDRDRIESHPRSRAASPEATSARCSTPGLRHFPIIDVWIPGPDEADAFDALIAGIRASLDAGQRVVVHGRGGIGRVAASVVTTYGFAPADAIARVRQAQPLAVETRLQEAYVGQDVERVAG